jgi:peptide/nickel transport system substrate-binding protein
VFKKARYVTRLLGAILAKYYLGVIAGVTLGIITFLLAPRLLPFLPKFRPTQTIAIVGRFTQAEIPLFIQQQISPGLTTLATDGQVFPALAASWKVTDDNKTYVFTLDKTKKWQDGSPVRSQDLTYNFKDAIIEHPDDNTLIIRLTNAFSPLPVVVSRPIFKRGLLGAGDYKVTTVRKNGQIIESLTLSPLASKSQLPKIKYLFYASDGQASLAFKLGLARSLQEVSDTPDILSWPNVTRTAQSHPDRYVGIFFNTQDPIFTGADGKNLRLALAYAIDKTRFENRAYGPINPNSWAYNPDLKHFDLDLPHAKQLLAKVGKQPKALTISVTPAYLQVAEDIKSDWAKLGLKIDTVVVPEVPNNYSVLIIAQANPPDPDQYNLWHSTQADTNLTGLSNPRIDKLLEDGRKAQDPAIRKAIYLDFQKYLVEEVPVIFLFHPQTFTLARS